MLIRYLGIVGILVSEQIHWFPDYNIFIQAIYFNKNVSFI